MRNLAMLALVTAALLMAISPRAAVAADSPARHSPATLSRQAKPVIDDHDESRVVVQLIVLGLAIGVVVVAGTAAYFVRRRLGLTAYDADAARAAQDGHH